MGWLAGMILWITNHTTLSVSIVVIVIAIIIGLWAIRDARKKISDIYKLEPTLETMFDIAISRAEEKANLISVNDKELKDTLARIAQVRIPVKVDTIPLQSGHLSGANRTLPGSGEWRGVESV
jgi:hypothetical protein